MRLTLIENEGKSRQRDHVLTAGDRKKTGMLLVRSSKKGQGTAPVKKGEGRIRDDRLDERSEPSDEHNTPKASRG